MNNVYFVIHDSQMHERQSDGVELCKISKLCSNTIFFYCTEYQVYWKKLEDLGEPEKCEVIGSDVEVKPATLAEVSDAGLCEFVGSIKEYCQNDNTITVRYIHLKEPDF